jgi:transposase
MKNMNETRTTVSMFLNVRNDITVLAEQGSIVNPKKGGLTRKYAIRAEMISASAESRRR